MYWLKYLHVSCVVLSISGFILRALWRLKHPQDNPRRWLKVVPHLVDSTLFFSGLAMVIVYQWYPTQHDWLATKLAALLLYIGLGFIALRKGSAIAALAAVITFTYIVAVALSKQPIPW